MKEILQGVFADVLLHAFAAFSASLVRLGHEMSSNISALHLLKCEMDVIELELPPPFPASLRGLVETGRQREGSD